MKNRFRPSETVPNLQKQPDPEIESKQRQFVYDCRRKVEELSREQIRESELRVQKFMSRRFSKKYIALNHHLMAYQEANIMRQHSKTTPASELSVYNFFTGGEGQTEEQMSAIAPRDVSKIADKEEDVEEAQWRTTLCSDCDMWRHNVAVYFSCG